MRLFACAAIAATVVVAPLPPVISRLSGGGVGPNETLLVQGAGLASASLKLCPLRGGGACQQLPAAPSSWDGGLKVTLPASPAFAAAFAVAACSAETGCSDAHQVQRFVLNAPRVTWLLGDGETDGGVAAGGTLQAFGSALAFDVPGGRCAPAMAASGPIAPGSLPPAWEPDLAASRTTPPPNANTSAALCAPGGGPPCVPLAVAFASCFRLDVAVPAGTPPGAYSLLIDNGLADTLAGGGAPVPVAVAAPVQWPDAPFPVGGACGPSVLRCVAAATAAGGGIVTLPAGVTAMPQNAVLALGGRVRLVGAAGGSVLQWGTNTAEGAPSVSVACVGAAQLANLTLLFTSPVQAALGFNGSGCVGDGLNVTVAVPGTFPIGAAFAAAGARHWRLTGSLLSHAGNCSRTWPHNTAYTVWGSADGRFAHNSVLCYCQGHSTDSSSRVVFDGNAVWSLGTDSQGDGFSTFEAPQVLEHIYVGRSLDVGNPAAAKRWESMTLDGPGGAAFAAVAALSSDGTDGQPQVLTLATPGRAPGPWDKNISAYLGASVSVLYGPGLGGLARVAGIAPTDGSWTEASTWTLDPPLLTRPAAGGAAPSFVAINPHRGGLVWEADTFVNDTTFQFWAQATDAVVAGSVFQNISGDVRNWALYYQCGWANFSCAWQPNVGVDFQYNTLRCAHALGAVTSDYGALPPVPLTLNVGLTRRGNTLAGGTQAAAEGRTADLIFEHTAFEAAACDNAGGPPTPAGGYDVNASLPWVLVR